MLPVLWILPAAEAQEAKKNPVPGPAEQPVTEDRFEIRNIQGWLIYTNREVLKAHPEQMAKTYEHLKWDLYQTKLAVPATAVANMQQHTPIWIEYNEKVSLSYHPETEWLLQRGYVLRDRNVRRIVALPNDGRLNRLARG